jgi:alcohol dehydrogenase
MAGFKDFFQYASATRVVAGRDLLASTGFEMGKEGAHRVWLVTDRVIRDTGLVERVEAGVADETTRTLPPAVAAATGMDAVTHAIEGYVSADWSPPQDARSLQALRIIRGNLERAVERGKQDEEARGNMLVAANLAITIALGSVHAMSHSAGAHFGVPHGVANAIHLPHVIRHNAAGGEEIAGRYRDIGELFDVHEPEIGEALAAHVTELTARLGLPTRLSQVGVPEEAVPALVEGAMGDGTTLVNPREMGEEDYAELYRAAL